MSIFLLVSWARFVLVSQCRKKKATALLRYLCTDQEVLSINMFVQRQLAENVIIRHWMSQIWKICYIILPQIIRPDLAVLLLDWFSKLSSSNDILLITNFSRENGLKFLNYQARPCGFSSNRNSRKSTSYTRCNGGILLIFRQKFCDFLKTHVV